MVDTHVLIWAATTPGKLSSTASKLLSGTENILLVSAASAWEVATKVRLGKLPEAILLEADFVDTVTNHGYTVHAITAHDALRAGRLPGEHRDPFDRMIAAQALALDIPVISSDAKLDIFGIRRLW